MAIVQSRKIKDWQKSNFALTTKINEPRFNQVAGMSVSKVMDVMDKVGGARRYVCTTFLRNDVEYSTEDNIVPKENLLSSRALLFPLAKLACSATIISLVKGKLKTPRPRAIKSKVLTYMSS